MSLRACLKGHGGPKSGRHTNIHYFRHTRRLFPHYTFKVQYHAFVISASTTTSSDRATTLTRQVAKIASSHKLPQLDNSASTASHHFAAPIYNPTLHITITINPHDGANPRHSRLQSRKSPIRRRRSSLRRPGLWFGNGNRNGWLWRDGNGNGNETGSAGSEPIGGD